MHYVDARRVHTHKRRHAEWRGPGAWDRRRFAVRRERNPLPVRRPGRSEFARGAVGEIPQVAARQVEHPDVRLPTARGHEHDRLCIGRERRLIVERIAVGDLLET